MKIMLFSDVHTEMHKDQGHSFIDSLNSDGVDLLVMAGDIMYLNFFDNAKSKLKKLLEKYKKIIYVLGNHDFYTSQIKKVERVVERLRKEFPSDRLFIVMEPEKYNIDGYNFLCGPMWFPYNDDNKYFEDLMNDKHYIHGFLPSWVYDQNTIFENLVKSKLMKDDIVITHYLPSHSCVHQLYKNSALNRFFVCPMDELIIERKPKLWLFGHTHEPVDITLGETRLLCNPHGYIKEAKSGRFNEKLVIEI